MIVSYPSVAGGLLSPVLRRRRLFCVEAVEAAILFDVHWTVQKVHNPSSDLLLGKLDVAVYCIDMLRESLHFLHFDLDPGVYPHIYTSDWEKFLRRISGLYVLLPPCID